MDGDGWFMVGDTGITSLYKDNGYLLYIFYTTNLAGQCCRIVVAEKKLKKCIYARSIVQSSRSSRFTKLLVQGYDEREDV